MKRLAILLLLLCTPAWAVDIAFVLTHNRTTTQNRNQVTALAGMVTTTVVNGENVYTITGLNMTHTARFYQIVPNGTAIPTTFGALDSYNIYFGPDRPNTAKRFFNWAIKRAIDHGAQVIVLITDHALFTVADGKIAIELITGNKCFVERPWGYILGPKLLRNVGQMTEDGTTFAQALTALKARILAAGLEYE